MALHPTTSTFRKGAIALATAAALFAGSSAKATSDFSHDQCRLIAGVTTDVINAVGQNTLSSDFRQSMLRFIAPQGRLTCDGPKEIITPTNADIAAFNTIRQVLFAPPRRISLEQAGLRSVPSATTTVGALNIN